MRLIFSNLPAQATEKDLHPIFSAFGPVDHIELVKDGSGASSGAGIVQFEVATHARAALEQLDGLDVGGTVLIFV